MKKVLFLILTVTFFLTARPIYAQMMGGQVDAPSQADLQKEQSEQDRGQEIYQKLTDKTISCSDLTNDDFENLGDYFMGKSLGSTQNHYYMDQRMTQMMGESANTQMHIALGQRESGCNADAPLPSNTPSFLSSVMRGGGNNMMGFGGNLGYGMMGGYYGTGGDLLSLVIWLVVLVDLVLLGVFLWRKIRK